MQDQHLLLESCHKHAYTHCRLLFSRLRDPLWSKINSEIRWIWYKGFIFFTNYKMITSFNKEGFWKDLVIRYVTLKITNKFCWKGDKIPNIFWKLKMDILEFLSSKSFNIKLSSVDFIVWKFGSNMFRTCLVESVEANSNFKATSKDKCWSLDHETKVIKILEKYISSNKTLFFDTFSLFFWENLDMSLMHGFKNPLRLQLCFCLKISWNVKKLEGEKWQQVMS